MPQVTWRELAFSLGERMRHHAHCDDHPRVEADPMNCPFCHDRATFDQYVAKMNKQRRTK